MKRHWLQDAAKFAAGLVVGDLIMWWWLAANNLFPLQFLGLNWTADMILPGVVFDLAALAILVHYAWHVGKIPRMKERSYLLIAGIIFTVVAAAHILRIFTGTDIVIYQWTVPLWLSWVGTAVAAYLAYASFSFAARPNGR